MGLGREPDGVLPLHERCGILRDLGPHYATSYGGCGLALARVLGRLRPDGGEQQRPRRRADVRRCELRG
mgnify:CR=1 FL=1